MKSSRDDGFMLMVISATLTIMIVGRSFYFSFSNPELTQTQVFLKTFFLD